MSDRPLLQRLLRPDRGDERGAGMVEMALVIPVLILLVMGIFEFGMAWRSSLTVSNALRSGTRAAANSGEERLADYNALSAAVSAMANIDGAVITKIVIYKSATANGEPPASCLEDSAAIDGGITDLCNVYDATDLAGLSEADFPGTDDCSGALDEAWCPVFREGSQSAANGADFVGLYMQVEQAFQTGLFGSGITIEDDTVMRLEPQAQ